MPSVNASCLATSVLRPRWAGEQERADRLVRFAQPGARHLDRSGQRVDRRVLTEHGVLQIAIQVLELRAVVARHGLRRNARDLGNDLLDLALADRLLAAAHRQDALGGTGLVDDVDRLVRQMAVIDVLGRQLGRGSDRPRAVLDAVVLLEAGLESLEDLDRLLHRRLDDVDLLEATRQRVVLLEDAAVLVVGGGADALQLPGRQRRLQQVRRIQRAARGATRTDQRVDLVDEQHRIGVGLQLLEHRLQPLLEVAAVLGASQQRAHVQRVDDRLVEDLRHVVLDDAPGQALGDRGLADTGLAHQQRVVLAPAAQHLDHALDFRLATDQRIDLAVLGELIQVHRVLLERRLLLAALALLLFLLGAGRLGGLVAFLRRLGDAVADEVDDVQPRHALLVQVVHRVRVLLAEDRHQHVGAGHFLLAVAGALHVHDGALDHALEAERGLGIRLRVGRQDRRVVGDEVLQALAQILDVAGAGAQHFGGRRVVEQRQQQVLDGDEFVPGLPSLDEGHVQTDFEFLRDHASSITHCSGC